nr:hypothetical protein [Nocardia sp. CY41]
MGDVAHHPARRHGRKLLVVADRPDRSAAPQQERHGRIQIGGRRLRRLIEDDQRALIDATHPLRCVPLAQDAGLQLGGHRDQQVDRHRAHPCLLLEHPRRGRGRRDPDHRAALGPPRPHQHLHRRGLAGPGRGDRHLQPRPGSRERPHEGTLTGIEPLALVVGRELDLGDLDGGRRDGVPPVLGARRDQPLLGRQHLRGGVQRGSGGHVHARAVTARQHARRRDGVMHTARDRDRRRQRGMHDALGNLIQQCDLDPPAAQLPLRLRPHMMDPPRRPRPGDRRDHPPRGGIHPKVVDNLRHARAVVLARQDMRQHRLEPLLAQQPHRLRPPRCPLLDQRPRRVLTRPGRDRGRPRHPQHFLRHRLAPMSSLESAALRADLGGDLIVALGPQLVELGSHTDDLSHRPLAPDPAGPLGELQPAERFAQVRLQPGVVDLGSGHVVEVDLIAVDRSPIAVQGADLRRDDDVGVQIGVAGA